MEDGVATVNGTWELLAEMIGGFCNKAEGCKDITCEMVGICVVDVEAEAPPSIDVSMSPSSPLLLLVLNCSTSWVSCGY